MIYSTKELASKSEKELAAIAEELGLVLNAESTGKNGYILEIIAAQEEDIKEVAEPIATIATNDVATLPKKVKKFRIIVANQEGPEETRFVKVQVNQEMFAIPREVEVVVPEYVVEVLNNAVVTRYVQEGLDLVERKAKRFPFSILGEVK
jgi:hypothetical protein